MRKQTDCNIVNTGDHYHAWESRLPQQNVESRKSLPEFPVEAFEIFQSEASEGYM